MEKITPDLRFKVHFVKEGSLLEEAQSLRSRVFFGRPGLDKDRFDEFCNHIVVVDTDSNRVVGTYRLLPGSVASQNAGFYSETEFDLSNIKKNCRGELLEMGRACVDDAYRRYPVINMMWNAILSYVAENKIKYIIGCSSIRGASKESMEEIIRFLKDNFYGPEELRAYPLAGKKYDYSPPKGQIKNYEVIKKIPSLFRGYLKMGAFVCGEPIWDAEFSCVDFFMMLDTDKMNIAYQKKFI